jgi:hypothetical protein
MPMYYCYRCEAPKSLDDLRQVEQDEVCCYQCRQCGESEGAWLTLSTGSKTP